MLACFLSHLLPQLQHLQGGHWDGDAVVEHAFSWHLGVDDLPEEQERELRGEGGPRVPLCGRGMWVSEVLSEHVASGTHQRRVGGVPPALGPHQVQGIQGGILILGEPPCAAPHAFAHHCAGGERRGESAVAPPGDSASQAHGCTARVLTAMPHAAPCAHGVGLVLRPRRVLTAVLREVHSGEGGLPSALLGRRCAAERESRAVSRNHVKLPETIFKKTSLAGHQGSWAPTGLGTGKHSAEVPGRKVGWCFCWGTGWTLTQFQLGGHRRSRALLQIRAAGRNLLELAAGKGHSSRCARRQFPG